MSLLHILTERIRRFTPKQIVLIILCAILFITPSVFAIIYVHRVDSKDNDQTLSVALYSSDGDLLGQEIGTPELSDDNSLIGIFSQLDLLKEPISAPSQDLSSTTCVRAVLTRKQISTELLCYFSVTQPTGICKDNEGNFFSIDLDANQRFLSTSYGEAYYPASIPPSLVTIDGDTVVPSHVSWNYRSKDGHFLPSQDKHPTASSELYEITGEVGLRFSAEPDQCRVVVYEEDRFVYEGSHTQLSYLSVNTGSVLNIRITARWLQNDQAECYGDISYEFRVRIKNRSEFSVNTDTVAPGTFVVLSCTNVTDPQKILFTSEFIPSPPTFYRDGELYRTILAIPRGTTNMEALTFQISYGASTQSFSIKVTEAMKPDTFSYSFLDLSDSPLPGIDGEAYLREKLSRITPAIHSDVIYFRGNTNDPTNNGFTVGYFHGSTVHWGKELSESFTATGTEYLTSQTGGTSVTAWSHGIVLETGTDELLGNYVIIDHGGGLLTWYGHLSNQYVSRGTVVKQGETIGQTGSTGLATGNGYLFLCTVQDLFIDPQFLFQA